MKKLNIKKLITTSMLNMGFSMESVIDTVVSKNIINECIILMILSETLKVPGVILKIILAIEKLIRVINTKIVRVVSESNGLKIAKMIYNKKIVP
ncbi:MAG: hypothetical protein KGD70_03220 [Candidatus Lokiarchaeota archaeon]|nr:hypothetical protein [Candidatus Lokiarchaeota archaeon]